MSKSWIFAVVPRNDNGSALLEKATVLEVFKHDCEPYDRLKYWAQQYPDNLIYIFTPVASAVGFKEFKVVIRKHT
jgi:hypothetical protein